MKLALTLILHRLRRLASGPGGAKHVYVRPDGTSIYKRPDGTSDFVRP